MPTTLVFLASAAAIVLAGVRLARDGDVIGHGTGLGGVWVGAILLAAATSIPELATDISAVLQGQPALAVGDLFGSTMANMLILAVADLVTRQPRLLTRVTTNQVLVGTLGVLLTAIAAVGILTGGGLGRFPLGWSSVAIAVAYGGGMRLLHRNREAPPFEAARTPAEQPDRRAVRLAIGRFLLAAVAVLIAAPFLASSTAEIGTRLGLGHGLVGMVLLGATTSLPEAVVSITSIRAGAYGLAVGNLIGSTCFNMMALVPLDLVHGPGAILAGLDRQLVVGAMFGVILLALAMLDVLNKSERRVWAVEPGPALMIAVYFLGLLATHWAAP